jgi:hypothetical protein
LLTCSITIWYKKWTRPLYFSRLEFDWSKVWAFRDNFNWISCIPFLYIWEDTGPSAFILKHFHLPNYCSTQVNKVVNTLWRNYEMENIFCIISSTGKGLTSATKFNTVYSVTTHKIVPWRMKINKNWIHSHYMNNLHFVRTLRWLWHSTSRSHVTDNVVWRNVFIRLFS